MCIRDRHYAAGAGAGGLPTVVKGTPAHVLGWSKPIASPLPIFVSPPLNASSPGGGASRPRGSALSVCESASMSVHFSSAIADIVAAAADSAPPESKVVYSIGIHTFNLLNLRDNRGKLYVF